MSTADGTRLYFQRTGTGEKTIIAPGRLFIFDNLRELGDEFTVIAYDMRNRGKSDAVTDTTRLTIQADIEDLETVRAHFNVDRVGLVGYSYLGFMTALYTAAHPERVDRLAQLGPVPMKWDTEYPPHLTASMAGAGPDSAAVARVRQLDAEGLAASRPREFCEESWNINRFALVGNPANVDKLGASACDMENEWPVNFRRHLRYHFTSVRELTVSWDHFARVTQPVLTIHGTKDRNAAYGAGREWAMRLPNGRLLTIPNAAHQAFSEYPEIVMPALRAFFRGGWPNGAERITSLE